MFFISLDISYWHEWGKICTFWLSFRFDILQLIIRIIALILFNLSLQVEKSNINNSTDSNNVIHKVPNLTFDFHCVFLLFDSKMIKRISSLYILLTLHSPVTKIVLNIQKYILLFKIILNQKVSIIWYLYSGNRVVMLLFVRMHECSSNKTIMK